jgi:hypothetical protein
MALRSPHGGLRSPQVRAALYYARQRRLARLRAAGDQLLLSGDMTDGDDMELVSGDMQTGEDRIITT